MPLLAQALDIHVVVTISVIKPGAVMIHSTLEVRKLLLKRGKTPWSRSTSS